MVNKERLEINALVTKINNALEELIIKLDKTEK